MVSIILKKLKDIFEKEEPHGIPVVKIDGMQTTRVKIGDRTYVIESVAVTTFDQKYANATISLKQLIEAPQYPNYRLAYTTPEDEMAASEEPVPEEGTGQKGASA